MASRLGLEKMEREKQKSIEQDERDRLNRQRQEQQKQELLAIAADVTLGSKSKFVRRFVFSFLNTNYVFFLFRSKMFFVLYIYKNRTATRTAAVTRIIMMELLRAFYCRRSNRNA